MMQPSQHTKVALITGAARRIGAEIARILHENGMNVVLHYHTSINEAEKLCKNLNEIRPDSAITLQADLSVHHENLIKQAVTPWGKLDVLVNNASQFYKTSLGSITESAWNNLLDTNLKAPFFLSQAAFPYLAKEAGCIINIADIHAEKPLQDYPIYSISKAGLLMMTKALAKEFGNKVRVNAISPGPILWPENENELTESLKNKIMERTVLKRAGNPKDVAKAVLYFVRDADYVTGQILAVDAGRSLSM